MALVRGGANYRGSSGTDSGLAGIGLGTEVAIITTGAVDLWSTRTDSTTTDIPGGACVVVVAVHRVIIVRASTRRVAAVGGADVAIVTVGSFTAHAGPGGTGVAGGTGVRIVTAGAVAFVSVIRTGAATGPQLSDVAVSCCGPAHGAWGAGLIHRLIRAERAVASVVIVVTEVCCGDGMGSHWKG